MAKTVSEDAQIGMQDRHLEDPELEGLIEEYLDTADEAKRHNRAADKIKERMSEYGDVDEGTRFRCGRFIIPMRRRSGGGFEVPTWNKAVPGKITESD